MNQILLSDNPLDILRDDQWLSKNFKELLDLKSFDKGHKDNFQHTLRVLENVMDETQDIRLYYVALFHDLGKYKTKRYTTGGWVFHGHETVSARMLKPIYDRFKLDPSTFQFVYNIVRYHGETRNVFGENSTDSAIRRLYKNLIFNIDGADYQEIVNAFALFSKCDLTTKNEKLREEVVKNADTFLKRLEEILIDDDKKQKRYALNGNDIMETFNVKPGKDLGMVLKYIKVSVDSGKLPDDKKVLIDHVRETFFSKLF